MNIEVVGGNSGDEPARHWIDPLLTSENVLATAVVTASRVDQLPCTA